MNFRVNSWGKMILMVGCCVFTARAELLWDQKTICLDVHPLQVEDRTEFRFTNNGPEPVDILSVQTTCGCLKALANTNRIASGESGAIAATFDFRDKTGPQRKSIAVRSSDNPKLPAILYVEADIPEMYTLGTKRLDWPLNGAHEPKTCRMTNRLNEPIRLISVSSSSEQFAAELKTVREGFEYEVLVRPVKAAVPGLAEVTIQTECPAELPESRSYRFDACVR